LLKYGGFDMADIIEDIDSVIKSLNESVKDLETIKKTLENKNLAWLDESNLKGYLSPVIDSIMELNGSMEDFTWAASGPGRYHLEYIHKVYDIAGRRIDNEEKPIIKIEV
jgi:hypothetical protein